MSEQKFVVDQTGTLVGYPRLNPGDGWRRRTVASVTYDLALPNAAADETFVSGSVQSWSTTLSAALSEGDTEVTVAQQAGFVSGRRYLIDVEGDDDLEVEARAKTTTAGVAATANLDLDESVTGADLEGVTVTLVDSDGTTTTFEFDTGGGVSGGNVAVSVLAGTDATGCMGALASAIVGASGLDIDAEDPVLSGSNYRVVVTQGTVGDAGNTTITSAIIGFAEAFTGGLDTGPTVLTLAEPIPRAIASGATIRAFAVTASLTTGNTAEAGNGTIRWKATLSDGAVVVWDQAFRIMRRLPVSTLTPTKLTQAYPVVRVLRSNSDTDLEELIALAWEYDVLRWLEAHDIDEERVLSVEKLEPLHALACVLRLARPHPTYPRDALTTLEDEWNKVSDSTRARRGWYEAIVTEVVTPIPEAGRRVPPGIRLVR